MKEKVIEVARKVHIEAAGALAALAIAFYHPALAEEDIFTKSENGLRTVYTKIMSLAPKLIGVLGVIALLAWIFWPSTKGAEKGKLWFLRIIGGVIGLVCLGLIIATIVKYFGTGQSPLDQDFTKAGS